MSVTRALVLVVSGVFSGCATGDGPGTFEHPTDFEVYFVTHGDFGTPLDRLVLAPRPWLAGEQIARYDVSSHTIYLKKGVRLSWPEIPLRGKQFVVSSGREPCYRGTFWTALSSFSPDPRAAALLSDVCFYGPDILRLEPNDRGGRDQIDKRADPRILAALTRTGRYAGGLVCLLDRVVVTREPNSATCTYTYTLRNRDRDALYVLDPDRLGSSGFHFFTNGPYFINSPHDPAIVAERPSNAAPPGPHDEVHEEWLSLLPSGESMSRTVTLEGYPSIAPATYECFFAFPSPLLTTRKQRVLSLGRVWIGEVRARATVSVENL